MSRLAIALTTTLLGVGLAFPQALRVAEPDAIPERPESLVFDPLEFDVPAAEPYRHRLDNGVVVYVAEDHTFPLVSLNVLLRQGSHLEAPEEVGLGAFTGALVRTGGTERMAPEELDEQLEFLAADVSSYGGDTRAGASLRCITPVLEESLAIFFEVLRTPRFDEERLALEKANALEAMRQRNDDAGDILSREWSWLLYGREHYATRRMTPDDLEAIARDDLRAFHEKYWRPENMIVSVSGDVDTEEILRKLEEHMAEWPGSGSEIPWPPPRPEHTPVPGLYHVEKDIPQGKVLLGHLVPQWDDWKNPDRAALQVMDHILGGSGFTSRIMKRVRSDEGLAYSAGSNFSFDPFEPGSFTVSFQSKNETVARAARIALDEVRRIREEPVTEEELSVAKGSLVDSFPQRFDSARQIVGTFAYDAYIGRDHDYWQRWRDEVRAVTAEDVQRVARRYLRPDDVLVLVVGKWDEIEGGGLTELLGGEVTHLPLRDPLTLR